MSKLTPLDPADTEGGNPPALGAAGTINIALKDWMLFAQDQLDGTHGRGKLPKAETCRRLHTPVTGNYALGWGAKLEPDGMPQDTQARQSCRKSQPILGRPHHGLDGAPDAR